MSLSAKEQEQADLIVNQIVDHYKITGLKPVTQQLIVYDGTLDVVGCCCLGALYLMPNKILELNANIANGIIFGFDGSLYGSKEKDEHPDFLFGYYVGSKVRSILDVY